MSLVWVKEYYYGQMNGLCEYAAKIVEDLPEELAHNAIKWKSMHIWNLRILKLWSEQLNISSANVHMPFCPPLWVTGYYAH